MLNSTRDADMYSYYRQQTRKSAYTDTTCSSISLEIALPVTPDVVNPLIATLKSQCNGASYSNTVIGTLAVDGWAARCTKCNSPPINGHVGQCTNFVLFDVTL